MRSREAGSRWETPACDPDRNGRPQLFQQQLDSVAAQPLISSPDDEENAVLSADGAWLLYFTTPHGEGPPKSLRLMRTPLTGGAAEQILETSWDLATGFDCPTHPDASCLFSRREKDALVFYALDPLRGIGKEAGRTREPVGRAWAISPDGARIAIGDDTGLRLIDLRNGVEHELPSTGLVWSVFWSPDGKSLVRRGAVRGIPAGSRGSGRKNARAPQSRAESVAGQRRRLTGRPLPGVHAAELGYQFLAAGELLEFIAQKCGDADRIDSCTPMSTVSDPERSTGKPEKNGGDDGTRTRGLCRDRAAF